MSNTSIDIIKQGLTNYVKYINRYNQACQTRDTLVSSSDTAKDMPGRAQTLPNAYTALPPS